VRRPPPRAKTADDGGPAGIARIGTNDLSDHDVAQICDFLHARGIVERLETEIGQLVHRSTDALERAGFERDATAALTSLAEQCAWRTS